MSSLRSLSFWTPGSRTSPCNCVSSPNPLESLGFAAVLLFTKWTVGLGLEKSFPRLECGHIDLRRLAELVTSHLLLRKLLTFSIFFFRWIFVNMCLSTGQQLIPTLKTTGQFTTLAIALEKISRSPITSYGFLHFRQVSQSQPLSNLRKSHPINNFFFLSFKRVLSSSYFFF